MASKSVRHTKERRHPFTNPMENGVRVPESHEYDECTKRAANIGM